MQAIPSTTPLSRTAFCTSSVMSLTVRPPAVRRRVSCWNTFIVAAILRESLPDSAVEPAHPQRILKGLRLDRGPLEGGALVVRDDPRLPGVLVAGHEDGLRLGGRLAVPRGDRL